MRRLFTFFIILQFLEQSTVHGQSDLKSFQQDQVQSNELPREELKQLGFPDLLGTTIGKSVSQLQYTWTGQLEIVNRFGQGNSTDNSSLTRVRCAFSDGNTLFDGEFSREGTFRFSKAFERLEKLPNIEGWTENDAKNAIKQFGKPHVVLDGYPRVDRWGWYCVDVEKNEVSIMTLLLRYNTVTTLTEGVIHKATLRHEEKAVAPEKKAVKGQEK